MGEQDKDVVIVESPAKAKAISKYLGEDYGVEASKGHVRDLPPDEFGVDVEDGFEPTYRTLPDSRRTVGELREKVENADTVYLAPDPDREGEAIAWHLQHALRLPEDRVRRVTFNEVTKSAVREAFNHPGDINMNLVNAQQARRILDRIVGYELSPLISKKVVSGLSAGRVQSVALRLICDREKEIRAFEPEEYWKIEAELAPGEDTSFRAWLKKWKDEKPDLSNEEEAQAVCDALQKSEFTVSEVEQKKTSSNPPAPFTTSTLQQSAGGRLSFSASRTMRAAQTLYEGVDIGEETVGLITYMRTDSTRVAGDALESARNYVEDNMGEDYLPEEPNVYESDEQAQGAHEAIRPTDVNRTPEEMEQHLSRDQQRLYELIWRRFVASQMKPAVYKLTRIRIEAGDGLLEAKGRKMVFDGYTKVLERRGQKEDQLLPQVEEGQTLKLEELDPTQHFTQPPNRYREASLVKELEKQGIGRPSTYAPIISTLKRRNYVNKKKGTLYPTDLGMVVADKLANHFPREMDTRFTSKMEGRLDQIEEGEENWKSMLEDFYSQFHEDLEQARQEMTPVSEDFKEEKRVCEECGQEMIVRFSRKGRKFLGCSGFPNCRNTASIGEEEEQGEETEHECPKCGSMMLKREGQRGGKYLACSAYPDCRNIMGLDDDGNPVELADRIYTQVDCPNCGGTLFVETPPDEEEQEDRLQCSNCSHTRDLVTLEEAIQQTEPFEDVPAPECPECGEPMDLRRSKNGLFLGCTRYPDCEGTDNIGEGDLPDPVPTIERCNECGRPMVLRWGRYGRFLGCSGFPRCRNIWNLRPAKKDMRECPEEDCDGTLYRKYDEDGEEYYGCSRHPECEHTLVVSED